MLPSIAARNECGKEKHFFGPFMGTGFQSQCAAPDTAAARGTGTLASIDTIASIATTTTSGKVSGDGEFVENCSVCPKQTSSQCHH
jgi:hypothetical protein